MAGVALHVDRSDLTEAHNLADRLVGWQIAQLAQGAGELMANQSKKRIELEKAAPDGTLWDPWSEEYAATCHGGHSLLRDQGPLLESLQNYSTAEAAIAGSNLAYAAIHQQGSEDGTLPARPYLGLSDDNEKELDALIVREVERVLQ